jgi:Ca2+-binding EF-hand superfamily protein
MRAPTVHGLELVKKCAIGGRMLEHVYCEEAFKLIDKDGNGVLTRPEVRALALVCDNIAGSHTAPHKHR